MKPETRKWLGRAKKDLDTARLLLENKKHEESAFFSQQAAEKALKALSLEKHKRIRKIHDLVELGRDVKLPEHLLDDAKELTMAYVYSRYPDVEESKDLEEIAAGFLKYAEEILKWVETNL